MKKIFLLSAIAIASMNSYATVVVHGDDLLKKKVPHNHKKHISPRPELKLPNILIPGEHNKKLDKPEFKRTGPTIQLAILLDTSGSMSGLIEQVKNQIWDIINETSKANKDEKDVVIEVALFEYGKDTISKNEGYVQMLSPLTSDLDSISEELFELRTNGGSEYAGKAILESVNRLSWSDHEDDLKIVIIAGNESFEQGNVEYEYAINKALDKSIVVNTVFCGGYREGVNLKWKRGSDISGGAYLNIDHNDKIQHIVSPYDDEINDLGYAMNKTYVNYGAHGDKMKERQSSLDSKTMSESKAVLAKRNAAKASKSYDASSWDLISKFSESEESQEEAIISAKESEQFNGLSDSEISEKIVNLSNKRSEIKDKINELTIKRDAFIKEERSKKANNNDQSFGSKLILDIKSKAERKGYEFK